MLSSAALRNTDLLNELRHALIVGVNVILCHDIDPVSTLSKNDLEEFDDFLHDCPIDIKTGYIAPESVQTNSKKIKFRSLARSTQFAFALQKHTHFLRFVFRGCPKSKED